MSALLVEYTEVLIMLIRNECEIASLPANNHPKYLIQQSTDMRARLITLAHEIEQALQK